MKSRPFFFNDQSRKREEKVKKVYDKRKQIFFDRKGRARCQKERFG